jgi:hypothetical protein
VRSRRFCSLHPPSTRGEAADDEGVAETRQTKQDADQDERLNLGRAAP